MFNDVMDSIGFVTKSDSAVGEAMAKELVRQQSNIELIASENLVSPAVMAAMGSVLTNKYAEGYPSRRYYGGCEHVDVVESIAIERAKEIFGAEHANVQPHSGAQANFAVYFALLEVGDTVLGMDLSHGGHLTHGSPVNVSGKYWNFVSYGLGEDGYINYDAFREFALKEKPKLIVAGASNYSRIIDFNKVRAICDEVGAYMMVDMAHIAGLVAAGVHPSPFPMSDVVTTTTHKTLRGPRGGMILCKENLAKIIDKSIFPGTQGGPLEHVIAAKAVAFGEALRPEFKAYQQKIVDNAKVLAKALQDEGVNLISGGTDNHLMTIDLRGTDVTGKELEARMDEVCITANKNTVPNDPQSPFVTSGVRIGTPAVTTRGFGEEEMKQIAKCIADCIFRFDETKDATRAAVASMVEKYPIYEN